jgi:hypothetical protein
MTPGHLPRAPIGLAHFLCSSFSDLITAWHRGHMPIGQQSLTASKLALVDILASNVGNTPTRR